MFDEQHFYTKFFKFNVKKRIYGNYGENISIKKINAESAFKSHTRFRRINSRCIQNIWKKFIQKVVTYQTEKLTGQFFILFAWICTSKMQPQ